MVSGLRLPFRVAGGAACGLVRVASGRVLVRVLLVGFEWRMRERRGGLMCDFDALCDFDRRIHTSESHEASISHVIWLAGAARAEPAGTGMAYAVTAPCAAGSSASMSKPPPRYACAGV
jgi:hypothetical protein